MPVTQENYSRAGSTLVVLRKETGVTEISILRYMVKSHVPGIKISFPDAAALSAILIAAGVR
jgi:hypothetical protein